MLKLYISLIRVGWTQVIWELVLVQLWYLCNFVWITNQQSDCGFQTTNKHIEISIWTFLRNNWLKLTSPEDLKVQ